VLALTPGFGREAVTDHLRTGTRRTSSSTPSGDYRTLPELRRSLRSGLKSEVVVVRLRRKSLDEPHEDNGEEGGVAWSHRWLVSGHWRNQWLPSRTCHRLQWIHGYVKGPAHKALVVKDRVTAWIR
jgi:hypothetical protein